MGQEILGCGYINKVDMTEKVVIFERVRELASGKEQFAGGFSKDEAKMVVGLIFEDLLKSARPLDILFDD